MTDRLRDGVGYLDSGEALWVEVSSDVAVVSSYLDSSRAQWVEVSGDGAVVCGYLDSGEAAGGGGIE
ncbi:hypothetical protein [Nostocoides japonicum]|uniref:hypothetical protein n=1 Tax=Nostocoides japonicum TaxID=99481 RepID=UPI00065C196D|nr:hypothetical protein [Tetrasphaera japonica]